MMRDHFGWLEMRWEKNENERKGEEEEKKRKNRANIHNDVKKYSEKLSKHTHT